MTEYHRVPKVKYVRFSKYSNFGDFTGGNMTTRQWQGQTRAEGDSALDKNS